MSYPHKVIARLWARHGFIYLWEQVPRRFVRLCGLESGLAGRRAKLLALLVLAPGLVLRLAKRAFDILVVVWGPVRMYREISGRVSSALLRAELASPTGPDSGKSLGWLSTRRWASPDLVCQAIGRASKIGRPDIAKHFADRLLAEHPDFLPMERQAGIEAFLGGNYPLAEQLWGKWEDKRSLLLRKWRVPADTPRLLGHSWLIAIGHIAHLDTYFKWRTLTGTLEGRFAFNPLPGFAIPNDDLVARWRAYLGERFVSASPPADPILLDVVQDEFWGLLLPNGEYKMFSYAGSWVQAEWQRQRRAPLLSLSEEDHSRAAPILRKLGIPKGRWFVCLHVREPGFHEAWHQSHPATRNADIDTYREAAKAIVARGGYVVRMGDPTMKKLRPILGVVDYAHSPEKSAFMDIYLSAACKFFIGTNSGLGLVPPVFGVPCALTNWSPIGLPQWYPHDLFIPKLCYSERLGRYLTLDEMFGSIAGWSQFADDFLREGYRLDDNTPEDLREFALEMLDRETGRLQLYDGDRERRAEYERIAYAARSYLGAGFGARFLRKHEEVLLPNARRAAARVA